MRANGSVRDGAYIGCGEGPTAVLTNGGDSPCFLHYCTDNQLGGIAAFCVMHSACETVEFIPTWEVTSDSCDLYSVEVECPECRESRVFHRERG